jgi:hypothetical protein
VEASAVTTNKSPTETSQRPLVIEVLLDGEVIATGTCSSETVNLLKLIGMPLVPAMLRKIADKWEAKQ